MPLYFELALLCVCFFLLVIVVNGKKHNQWKHAKEKNLDSENKTNLINGQLKEFNGPIRLPIIGSALQWFAIGCTRNMYDTIHEFCRRYGSVCGVWGGSHYFVFVEDPALAREFLQQENLHRKFPSTSITYELYGPLNLGISQAHGDVLKEMRRFTSRGLRRFGFGKFASMDDIVQLELSNYLKEFENSRQEGNGIVHMNEAFYISTLNILWRLMTGGRFTQNDSRLVNIIRHAREILKSDPVGGSLPFAFHFLAHIPGLTPFQAAQNFWTEIRALLREILGQRKAAGNHLEPECLMDLFINETANGENSMYNDAQCIQTCMDLFLAGLDSTANTLDWIIIYLVSHPVVYEKVMKEIEEVIGYEDLPTLQHRSQMPYTESVMLEVMRIANVITYTMRAPLHETTSQGYKIPENSHIVIKLDCFHQSKSIWGDPEIFRPERFLDSNSKIINAEKVFTFGFGTRACIGVVSSKLSIFLFMTTFLQKYKLQVSPFHPSPSLIPQRGILITHSLPYHIKATPNTIKSKST